MNAKIIPNQLNRVIEALGRTPSRKEIDEALELYSLKDTRVLARQLTKIEVVYKDPPIVNTGARTRPATRACYDVLKKEMDQLKIVLAVRGRKFLKSATMEKPVWKRVTIMAPHCPKCGRRLVDQENEDAKTMFQYQRCECGYII